MNNIQSFPKYNIPMQAGPMGRMGPMPHITQMSMPMSMPMPMMPVPVPVPQMVPVMPMIPMQQMPMTQMPGQMPRQIAENFNNVQISASTPVSVPISVPMPSTQNNQLAMDGRPFQHMNMFPEIKKVTQNMAGTDVKQIDTKGEYVDMGYDKTTPFINSLNNYTGINSEYMHKREAGPMFSPAEQQTNWVHGQPGFRPEANRYSNTTVPNYKDLVPVQPIQVGPGLGLDPSVPAAGGFHDFTRVMPNNVSDYKANQLESRINMGKLTSAGLPTSYPGVGGSMNKVAPGIPKNRPPKDYSMIRRPVMSNKVGIITSLPELRSDYTSSMGPNNGQREQISYGYGQISMAGQNQNQNLANSSKGPIPCVSYTDSIGIAPSRPSINPSNRSPTYMSQDNNIRSVSDCNSIPMGAPVSSAKTGPIVSNYYVNETDRGTVHPSNVEQLNIKGPDASTFYTYTDAPKTTMKETTDFTYTGDPNKTSNGSKFYTYTDAPKTTMKETTEFTYTGDPNKTSNGSKFYTYTDAPKTTMKETTEFTYVGDPNKTSNGSKFYTYTDAPKSTIKQSTNFTYTGDPNKQSNGVKFYTYKDAPKSTIKQSTNFSYTGAIDGSSTKHVETSRMQYTGYSGSEAFSNIDYSDLKPRLKLGGADTYTVRATTLVKDYVPGPGRSNIRLDADDVIGKISYSHIEQSNGPGTLTQAIPNASRLQNNRFIGSVKANPNKIIGEDSRSLASYQTEQLKKNPLSIFTSNPNSEIPSFLADNNPTDYADLITDDTIVYNDDIEYNGDFSANVYPPNGDVNQKTNNNANTSIVYNEQTENDYNPFISQGSSRKLNSPVKFEGHAYSGEFKNDSSENGVYGPEHNKDCEPNPALNFGSNTLILQNNDSN